MLRRNFTRLKSNRRRKALLSGHKLLLSRSGSSGSSGTVALWLIGSYDITNQLLFVLLTPEKRQKRQRSSLQALFLYLSFSLC